MQQVIAELGVEGGQTLVDLRDLLLLLGGKLGAGAHKIRIVVPYQPLLLGVQLGLFRRLVDGLNALEQGGILQNLVAVGGQLGGHFHLHRAEFV